MLKYYYRGDGMKNFIKLSVKWKYTWPMWLMILLYTIVAVIPRMYFTEWALPLGAVIVCASLLLASGRWYGSCVGLLYGIFGMWEYYTKIKNLEKIVFDERIIGVAVIVYYIFMGWLCYRENKRE